MVISKSFLILLVLVLLVSGCTSNDGPPGPQSPIPIQEMSIEEVFQQMDQSNSKINKYDMDMSLTYDMARFFPDENVTSKTQISSTGYYDRVKKESYTKGTIIDGDDGTEVITEIEINGDYRTEKRNGEIVKTTKLEEGAWEEEIQFPVGSLDPYYIPMGEDFERSNDETVDGIDCYVMIMRQDVQKSIESALAPEDQNANQNLEIPEGTGEVYVKIWLDKTDFHIVKSKSFLNITTEMFSWLIDGEVLISHVS
ncbi:MAG: hypothetical protein JXC85_04000 [Candidatus Aenigmarchaeota archaeon]|nr:hypothetical protein [Candidatus Aenigmarchaeota archaeon]